MYTIVNLEGIAPKSSKYKYLTTESSRIDMHSISLSLQNFAMAYAKTLSKEGGPYLRTHSIKNRLKIYVNKRSKNGKYIEVLPKEVDELKNLSQLLTHADLQVVEVGFNRQKEICKMAFTTTLISSGRVLFMCIGMDGGLKTFYVTPSFKWRKKYQYSDITFRPNAQK